MLEIGIDIGGTFTDVVCRDDSGRLVMLKVPSTRGNESEAVRGAISAALDLCGRSAGEVSRFAHGTTVATNAVLERKGARIGLLTTKGFRDVFEIGRQNRRNMYDLRLQPGAPTYLLPGHLRREVCERLDSKGQVVTPLAESSVKFAVSELLAARVEAIAVSYLFSFLNPTHERRTAEIIAQMAPDLPVSLSCEVDPSFREFERTCVTAFDASVKPVIRNYLGTMQQDLLDAGVSARLQVIQSRGGLAAADIAAERPVRLFLSGPAAGVIGTHAVGTAAGIDDLIAIDVGGTSTDVSVITAGRPAIRQEGFVGGYPVRVPMVDVNAIGSGGGSIAWIDGAGGLRLGPQSAGAVPGPACYGRGGEEPTVTDASVVLGYINPDYFAGGRVSLDSDLAFAAVGRIAQHLGMSVEAAAQGIHRVANGQMAEGVRLMSVRRGIDPRPYSLLCLGGGGALHGIAVATEMGIGRVVVPQFPGVLAAFGLLSAPIEHEVTTGFGRELADTTLESLANVFAGNDASCLALMAQEGEGGPDILTHFVDLCYSGQSHTIELGLPDLGSDALEGLHTRFVVAHREFYGHATENPVRIVNLRSVCRRDASTRHVWPVISAPERSSLKGTRKVLLPGMSERIAVPVHERAALGAGERIAGPAIVEQQDTTTLIVPGWTGMVTDIGNVILTAEGTAS